VPGMVETLDSVLRERLRSVLDGRPATEAELRKLIEEGGACALLLRGQLERNEARLDELSGDPETSLSDLASALRETHAIRPQLEELESILGELQERAREARRSWVSYTSSPSTSSISEV
jgi:chromosome segregation ATPase